MSIERNQIKESTSSNGCDLVGWFLGEWVDDGAFGRNHFKLIKLAKGHFCQDGHDTTRTDKCFMTSMNIMNDRAQKGERTKDTLNEQH